MLIDLSDRAKLQVSGPDRIRFLNGQLTNDITLLKPGASMHSCALTAKGKLCADLFATALNGSIILDYEPALRESLPERLEKYLVADDVELTDVTGQFVLFHVCETAVSDAILPEATISTSHRFGVEGKDLLVPSPLKNVVVPMLKETLLTADEAERFRIEQGVPRWGAELFQDVIPIEAGLDTSAISYTKGCYLGQEIMSRLRSLGHVNRHLRGVRLSSGPDLQAGDRLVIQDGGKQIANITSACISERLGGWIGLAFVRRGFDQPGTIYPVSRSSFAKASADKSESSGLIGSAEVRSLPFV
jgi:folate-binding protein YgfZ